MPKKSIKNRLQGCLLKAARLRILRPLVMMYFNYLDQIFPGDMICENDCWKAFYHPKPDYPLHILILPKQGVSTLLDASNDSDDFYAALFQLVRALIIEHDLEERGYRLITNGGPNQSIPQWHWHLISENDGT